MTVKKSVLIVGSGGREHAIGWKFSKSPQVSKIYFAPGNAGTALVGENIPIPATDIKKLAKFAIEKNISLTFVGPEVPLSIGIVDVFQKNNLKIFGPNKNGAQLESSKAFSTEFMKKYNISQPESNTYNNRTDAKKNIDAWGSLATVIKVSGLAAGKGVFLPQSDYEAHKIIDDIFVGKIFGDAGAEVVLQKKITGPEVSIIAFTDGNIITPLLPSQDHKRVFEHDRGPNTGGMGAYAPAFVSEKDLKTIQEQILEPTLNGLKKEGIIYKGILYAGLMLTDDGPKVLEFNVRFGDPETQPLMMLLKSDIFELSEACIEGRLTKKMIEPKIGYSACVVLAAKGYPESYQKGEEIKGLDSISDRNIQIFHSGTTLKNNKVVTDGGRVLAVTAYENSVKNACAKIYSVIGEEGIHFKNMHYRKDIGYQAIK